jgi:hypothetical protein
MSLLSLAHQKQKISWHYLWEQLCHQIQPEG